MTDRTGERAGPFRFDGDYGNPEQVRPYLEGFARRHTELVTAGRFPYNAELRGHIPGIEGPDESAAFWLLRLLSDLEEIAAKREEFIASGAREITLADLADGQVLRGTVVQCGFNQRGTGWLRFDSARVLPRRGWMFLLEKGRRTNGRWLARGTVLIRET